MATQSVARRIRFDYDPEPDLSWLDQWNTPKTYRGNEVVVDGKKLPFAAYMQTYGDPNNYENLMAICEQQCPCCGAWEIVDSLGGIAMYIDDAWDVGTYTDPRELASDYQRQIAEEMLSSEVQS